MVVSALDKVRMSVIQSIVQKPCSTQTGEKCDLTDSTECVKKEEKLNSSKIGSFGVETKSWHLSKNSSSSKLMFEKETSKET